MFWLLFFGQTITSFTYLMENNGCSKVSAIWFPPNERTLATTLFTLFASQVSESILSVIDYKTSLFNCFDMSTLQWYLLYFS